MKENNGLLEGVALNLFFNRNVKGIITITLSVLKKIFTEQDKEKTLKKLTY